MQRTLTQIHRAFASCFDGINGSRLALAAAVRECCADRSETTPFPVAGRTLQWITADYRYGDEYTDHPEDHSRRVLLLDGTLVDEPPPSTPLRPSNPVAPAPTGHWYNGRMWAAHEFLREGIASLGMKSIKPNPLPLCNPDTLREVAYSLPRIMTIWYALHLSTLEPVELFANLDHVSLRKMLSPC